VVTFEGGTADGIRAAADEFKSQVESGPPEGVKSNGITLLIDPEGGRVMVVGVFASEQDMRDSTPTLEAMSPPEGMGQRASVEEYEVGAEVRM
jgi:hypothetical protein